MPAFSHPPMLPSAFRNCAGTLISVPFVAQYPACMCWDGARARRLSHRGVGRRPASTREDDFSRSVLSRLQTFLYVQASEFARLPDRSYRCDLSSRGSRGFYVRAEHASFPPHASDMLTTRSGNWWCGDLHPTRFTALSAAPAQWGYYDN